MPATLLPALRLSHKLLLAFATAMAVVVALVGWNLFATNRLVRENQAIVRRAIPAVRLEVMLLEATSALRRLEARYGVLRDGSYLELFEERVRSMVTDMAGLERLLSTPEERAALREARARLADYRAVVGVATARATDHPGTRLEAALDQLLARSETELRRQEAATEALSERSRLLALVGLGACGLVGAATVLYAAQRIGRPLRRLEAATRAVADHAFPEPIAAHGRDEVAELTRAFNQMAARLRELEDLKDEFFSAISHDLRTPLTAIQLSAELLRTKDTLTPRQGRLVDGIVASCRRLLSLVNQIVELGRLKAGKLLLDRRSTDLRRVFEACVAEVRPLAEQADLKIDVVIAEGVPSLLADEDRLQQVLVNLLANAVKFSQPGGRIWLSAGLSGGDVLIKVTDTGIGIAPDRLPKIFDRYEQAHSGHGGSGIGLAIVKGIVEAHGGRVWVESEEGHGSCFAFTLPLEAGP